MTVHGADPLSSICCGLESGCHHVGGDAASTQHEKAMQNAKAWRQTEKVGLSL